MQSRSTDAVSPRACPGTLAQLETVSDMNEDDIVSIYFHWTRGDLDE